MSTKMQFRYFLTLLFIFLAGMLLSSACAPAAVVANPPLVTVEPGSEEPVQIGMTPAFVPATAVPTANVPATELPAASIPATEPPASTGTAITYGPLSLIVPPGAANGASFNEYPRHDSEDAAWWQKTPGHLAVMLGDYYVLQGKLHQPQIYVYPAQEYAELVPAAFEGIRRVNNILYGSGGPITVDQLPAVPFFNAQPVLAANIQTVSFQNGGGVRFLTQYAQGNTPVNNHELFYQFQGVTRDGAYYIVAIFPVTVPVLSETGEAAAALPSGGIAAPVGTDPNADWAGYYTAVTDLLNSTPPDAFTPAISQLDMLIASMQIAP